MPGPPTAEELSYMRAHVDDTRVPNIIACVAICGVASVGIISLRFVSRWVTKTSIQLSDWLILMAWVILIVMDFLFIPLVQSGAGRHIILLTDPGKARTLGLMNYTSGILYSVCMACIKFSIISLYWNIFPQKWFRRCLIALAVFMAMWLISGVFVAVFQCSPPAVAWNPNLRGGKCIDYGAEMLVAGVCNIITDFVLFALPIPLVLRLNMSTQKKRLVIFTFVMGGGTCIVSIARLPFQLRIGKKADVTWEFMTAALLSIAELTAGILCASIPTYRPLIRRIIRGKAGTATDYPSKPPVYSHDVAWQSHHNGASDNTTLHKDSGLQVPGSVHTATDDSSSLSWQYRKRDDEMDLM